ncbi:class I SAM-dependent methyltransferase [Lacibacterium aquatile]|uniref:Class I SAM-dependent methyltransferase n=1 Tax=Lacibacterium aquatile TaxID=1168082 RepID=A0ABW5DXE5_9PROT
MTIDPAAFIRAETLLKPLEFVPELRLHLADVAVDLWQATEETLEKTGLPPPYWAFAWPGGQGLARYLLDHPAIVAGKRVVDLGAGSGLTSLAAAKAGAASVLAVDIDVFALAAIQLNAAANGVTIATSDADLMAEPLKDCDLLLIGDLCYERPLAERVTTWARAQAARGIPVLLADPGRAYLPETGLQRITTYTIPTNLDLEDHESRETAIFRLMAP